MDEIIGKRRNHKNHITIRTDVHAAVSEVSSPDTNHHSSEQFRKRESQARFRSAHVRLVPLEQTQQLHEGGYQAEATDVVEIFSEYSTSQTKSALEVKTFAGVSSPQA